MAALVNFALAAKHGSSDFGFPNNLLSNIGVTTMGPITPSNQNISFLSPPIYPADASSLPTLSASDVVKQLMDKVSFKLLAMTGDVSTALSPASLAPVLGMVLACIEDNNKKESILGIPEGSLTPDLESDIHQELGKFSIKHPYNSDDGKPVSSVNFIASDYHHRDEALDQILSTHYQTKKLNSDDGKNVADITDLFVKGNTEGKITTLFDGLDEFQRKNVRAVLGNVMEFRGTWKTRFDPADTTSGHFLCADGSHIDNAKMMCTTERVQYAENTKFVAIAKELQPGLKLVAIKPHLPSAKAIWTLNYRTINRLMHELNDGVKEKVELKLPKIDVAGSRDTELLEKIVQALGTTITAQDLSRLGTTPCDELHMVQKLIASIDEEGAHGKIATAAVSTLRCSEKTFGFNFNCPGYMCIVDSKGNRLLELVIKDGSYLVFDGSPKVTPAKDVKSDDKPNTPEHEWFERLINENRPFYAPRPNRQKPIGNASDDKTKDLASIDVNTLIQQKFNPNGEFKIIAISVRSIEISIKVNSLEEANKLRERILESIGKEEYNKFVKVWDIPCGIMVEVSCEARKKLLNQLASLK
ncbi:serpin family protein [Endozoicomonas sp. SCSIO W0465]|uniref:serpin family protein n=1 Tax=Endozoicomonas sp. SCSIO W0465 TaxID=2918516 RepID=UPI002074EDE1|nr:serpin family protein [Endozoicomonas sp. SCSIO W0465]USE36517.1 serpin family protein [Endozoicomonas sp. SCSIO W0465]